MHTSPPPSQPSAAPASKPASPRPWSRRLARLTLGTLLLAALGLVGAGAWVARQLRASLPSLDGHLRLPGLAGAVTVERDVLGTPTVLGGNRRDVARALGFVHGQERFFQMDLLRRLAAGELAELLGPAALENDREVRLHRLRAVARRVVEGAPPAERALISAYTEGVNAGLSALRAHPWEYLVLRTPPVPWREEDTPLVLLAMFIELQETNGARESAHGLVQELLPPALATFLTPGGTEWDAPIDRSTVLPPPVPGPEVLDLRALPPTASPSRRASLDPQHQDLLAGSNSWAVAATHTAHGGALLANDMHLALRVPHVWFRAVLRWPDPAVSGGMRQVVGVTLPGTAAMVVGSNGRVAWGFTNAQIDTGDLIVLDTPPGDDMTYLTPGGPRRLELLAEVIKVRGQPDQALAVEQTIWGPVVDRDHLGRRRVYRWVAQDPQAVNLTLSEMENADNLEAAQAIANRAGIPAQNFVAVDASGRIGWTIGGRIPRRLGLDGSVPTSWASGERGWFGWVPPREVPRLVEPPDGRLWTANNRIVGGDAPALLGDGGYANGARAGQIRDDILAIDKASERDLLAVQLDDRALFLVRWRDRALVALTPASTASSARRAELRRVLETTWTGRASVDSAAYRLVRDFRLACARRVLGPLTAPCEKASPGFSALDLRQIEGPLWTLLETRPIHLLDTAYASWDELELAALDEVAAAAEKTSGGLAAHTWGRRNTTRIRHPLSGAIPGLSRALDMPELQLPGDSNMPRVQAPAFGASERMVVSPGHEAEGIFHMPGGQSGHPLSPFYRAGHEAWARGEATPLLPGPPVHTLTLAP
ncbi:MAG TPA: penicillin acylase family protein [Thermoanaerobaculaceae bacterium]|nr:penicillin acylase family protein [Thermoanaerobaculaceae bacterium]